MTGLDASLKLGADIIVNTDADNQYCAADIPALVAPILEGRAEYVIGTRPIARIEHFSPVKKFLQKLGSYVVRRISGTQVEDAPSGFRALSRDADERFQSLHLHAGNHHSGRIQEYSDSLCSGPGKCRSASVPAGQERTALHSAFHLHDDPHLCGLRPFKFFFSIGTVFFLVGFLLGCRFLWHWLAGGGRGMTQSLILAAVLILMGTVFSMMAFIADLLSVNRQLLEDIQYRQRRNCFDPMLPCEEKMQKKA